MSCCVVASLAGSLIILLRGLCILPGRHVTLQGRPHFGCQVSFFPPDFSSAVVATCLLVTLVSNENPYSENRYSKNRYN
jgi:hypothetical protein